MAFGDGEPILFETMVLGGTRDRELYRYCTWQEAEDGHTAVVERYKVRGAPLQDHPSVSKARELADQTVKKASEISITSLIEQFSEITSPRSELPAHRAARPMTANAFSTQPRPEPVIRKHARPKATAASRFPSLRWTSSL